MLLLPAGKWHLTWRQARCLKGESNKYLAAAIDLDTARRLQEDNNEYLAAATAQPDPLVSRPGQQAKAVHQFHKSSNAFDAADR